MGYRTFTNKTCLNHFSIANTQVCCVATGNPLIASSALHWVCVPPSLRGQRSCAYLISSMDVWCTLPVVKGSLLMSARVESNESGCNKGAVYCTQNLIVHSIVHSSQAIRYTCTIYVHVQCMPIRIHGSRVPGSRVLGPGSLAQVPGPRVH